MRITFHRGLLAAALAMPLRRVAFHRAQDNSAQSVFREQPHVFVRKSHQEPCHIRKVGNSYEYEAVLLGNSYTNARSSVEEWRKQRTVVALVRSCRTVPVTGP